MPAGLRRGLRSGRALYSDDERIVLQAQRPVILNGIEDFVRKSDLIDRTVIVQMARSATKTAPT